jgi:hypothetical protein
VVEWSGVATATGVFFSEEAKPRRIANANANANANAHTADHWRIYFLLFSQQAK